jgi:hypothetical protein
LVATLNGQNTSLTLMLITLVWHFTLKCKPVAAGIFLGFLLYKPQFGLPFLGIFILSKRLKSASVALVILIGAILIGNLICGFDWLVNWLMYSRNLIAANAIANQQNAISIIGFTKAIFGPDNITMIFAAWSLSIVIGLFLSTVWYVGGRKACFTNQISLACTSIVLMGPHVMFYDIGICLIPFLAIREEMTSYNNIFILVVWLVGLAQGFSVTIGFSILFFLHLFIFTFSVIYFTKGAIKYI